MSDGSQGGNKKAIATIIVGIVLSMLLIVGGLFLFAGERLSIARDASANRAEITIRAGRATSFQLDALPASSDRLLTGRAFPVGGFYTSGAPTSSPPSVQSVHLIEDGRGAIGGFFSSRPLNPWRPWRLRLSPQVPLTLEVATPLFRPANLDLRRLDLQSVRVEGTSPLRLWLPDTPHTVELISTDIGATQPGIEVYVPSGRSVQFVANLQTSPNTTTPQLPPSTVMVPSAWTRTATEPLTYPTGESGERRTWRSDPNTPPTVEIRLADELDMGATSHITLTTYTP